jgi:hypothetical protein
MQKNFESLANLFNFYLKFDVHKILYLLYDVNKIKKGRAAGTTNTSSPYHLN